MNTGVLLRMVRILSVLMWELNKGLRLVGKTALFDMDSYTIKRTFCNGNMSTIPARGHVLGGANIAIVDAV